MQNQVEGIFSRAWQLLTRNWIIMVPGLAIGAVAGFLTWTTRSTDYYLGQDGSVYGYSVHHGGLLASIIGLAAVVCNIAYTTGMAGAAWTRGTTVLADGTAALREDAGRIVLAILLLAVIAIVVGVLTLGIGVFVFAFFALYTMPAVVLENASPWPALKESCAIAARRWVPTLVVVLLLAVVVVLVGFAAVPFALVPVLGPVVIAILNEFFVAYATLVVVGEFLALRGMPLQSELPLT